MRAKSPPDMAGARDAAGRWPLLLLSPLQPGALPDDGNVTKRSASRWPPGQPERLRKPDAAAQQHLHEHAATGRSLASAAAVAPPIPSVRMVHFEAAAEDPARILVLTPGRAR